MHGEVKYSKNPESLNMKKPKKAKGTRKKIGEDMGRPGGPHTPGAKGTYKK